MKKLPILIILSLGAISLASSPVSAQKQAIVDVPPKSRLSCDEAISNVRADLIQRGFFKGYSGPGGRPPEVRVNPDSIQREYYDYPPNRTQEILFSTVFATDLFSSPRLMATLSSQIMAECTQVGMVYFADYEGGQPVGYFNDNTARTFIGKKRVTRWSKQQWGYYFFY
jgi:hypothetical protein